jgi:hypothetical protein
MVAGMGKLTNGIQPECCGEPPECMMGYLCTFTHRKIAATIEKIYDRFLGG